MTRESIVVGGRRYLLGSDAAYTRTDSGVTTKILVEDGCDALLIVMFVWGFAMAVGRLVTAWLDHGTYRRKLEEYEALRTRWGALNAQVRASVPVR